MKLTVKRLKDIVKDAKTLGCSAVALVVDTLAVPVDMCRDVVNKYQENKVMDKYCQISKESPVKKNKDKIKKDIESTQVSPPKPRKKVNTQCQKPVTV